MQTADSPRALHCTQLTVRLKRFSSAASSERNGSESEWKMSLEAADFWYSFVTSFIKVQIHFDRRDQVSTDHTCCTTGGAARKIQFYPTLLKHC